MSAFIWKFPLSIEPEQAVAMPDGAYILSCQMQGENPCLWAMVRDGRINVYRLIRMFGTGHVVECVDRLRFIDTIQLSGGSLVFHVFEER